jgi:hypothetical protein
MEETKAPTPPQVDEKKNQGAVLGGWVCLAIGTGLMIWSLLTFLLYLPLFLASFVLGIVAIAQRRLANGISILLLSVVVPVVFGLGLGAYRMHTVLTESSVASKSSPTPTTSPVTATSTTPVGPTAEQIYIHDHLELYAFEAKYMQSVLDGRIPGVTFKLRNKRDRTLDRVKVVVLFKDRAGAVIAEKEFLPVLVTEFGRGDDNTPLRPGYIWQMERGRFYGAKAIPTEWKEGAAEARVTEIRFAKEK